MKMILAIIDGNQSEAISQTLLREGFRVTRLASIGGFLQEKSTTLMIGVEKERLERALAAIRTHFPDPANPADVRATIYVLNVKRFDRV